MAKGYLKAVSGSLLLKTSGRQNDSAMRYLHHIKYCGKGGAAGGTQINTPSITWLALKTAVAGRPGSRASVSLL